MKHVNACMRTAGLLLLLAMVSCQKNSKQDLPSKNLERVAALQKKSSTAVLAVPGPVSVYASGLQNPRGLKFGPDGNLYVAEGGPGGTVGTTGCDQVIFPVGPYLGSRTGGRISRINAAGERTTVTDRLPSSSANEIIGGDVEGVADVAFIGNTLYAVLAGAGCSHGVLQTPTPLPNGIVKVNSDGSWNWVANLSAWQQAHPVANSEEEDFEPDGTWYSLIAVNGDLYALEPNHGELVKVTTGGTVSRVLDISASQGHVVPTALAYRGNFFVGNLHPFPIPGGASNIYKINPGGQIKVWVSGLNTVLGLVIDANSRMYVLEMTAGAPYPTPGLGRILRIDPNGTKTVIATGLSLPTGMTMGPDGNLYVSNWGFSPYSTAGHGEILKIQL